MMVQNDDTEIWSILPDGLTLEMVLDNNSPSPFSLNEFKDYLKSTYCYENLLFYQSVIEYKNECKKYFDISDDSLQVMLLDGTTKFNFSSLNKGVLSTNEDTWFELLMDKFHLILKNFILSDSPNEINIPYEIRSQLLSLHRNHLLYHPIILYPALNAIIELMRISSFIPFVTDSNRLYCPLKNIRKQKSTPALTQTSILPLLDENTPHSVGFFKKLSNTFKLRTTSSDTLSSNSNNNNSSSGSSSSRSNWRQINIPDLSPFKSISTSLMSNNSSSNNNNIQIKNK